MAKYTICQVRDLPPGERKIVEAGTRTIGIFNVNGTFHAIRNQCPHQNAPLCRGIITGTTLPSQPGEYIWTKDGEIIRCPWHGWEFDITTGFSVFNPHKMRVKNYEVTVEPSPVENPGEDVEAVESFTVTVEDGWVILHA